MQFFIYIINFKIYDLNIYILFLITNITSLHNLNLTWPEHVFRIFAHIFPWTTVLLTGAGKDDAATWSFLL